MRKILVIIFILGSYFVNAQSISNRSSQTITVQDARWKALLNAILPTYNDTTTNIGGANYQNNIGLDSCGAMIYTYSDNIVWVRQCVNGGKRWGVLGGLNGTDTVYVKFPLGVYIDSSGHQVIFIRTNNGLVSGGIVTKHDCWTVDVTAAIANMNYRLYTSLASLLTIDSSDAVLGRRDRIVVDTFGVVSVLKGDASITPVEPAYNPSVYVSLAIVDIPAGATCLPITSTVVFDGIGDNPAQWDTAKFGTITANFSDITNPYHLNQDLFISTYTDSAQVKFTHPSGGQDTVQASSTLAGALYLNNRLSNQIQVQFFLNSTPVSARTVINPYINTLDTGQYQIGAIPFGAFNFTSQIYNKIVITLAGYDTSGAGGFYLDWIRIQTGITPTLQNNFVDSVKNVNSRLVYYVKGIAYDGGAISGGGGSVTVTATGDATGVSTTSSTPSLPLTLATVNSYVGTFGSATQVAQVTVNAKGLTTAASNVTITPAASSITGGQALTKVDDANVTATLTGTPTTALLQATGITLGWTGSLSIARGGTNNGSLSVTNGNLFYGDGTKFTSLGIGTSRQKLGVVGGVPAWTDTTAVQSFTPAALTKTDDANVTLTLGGTPATALLQAASITAGWTGSLSIARGGTNNGSLSVTNGNLIYADGTKLVGLGVGTAGQHLLGGTIPHWGDTAVASGGSSAISALTAAVATNAIGNANYKQSWQWTTLGADTALVLRQAGTAAASNLQTVLGVVTSGANSTSTQTTFGGIFSNTHTGTTSTNIGLSSSASGATNNYAAVFPSGFVAIGNSAPSVPLTIQTPTTNNTYAVGLRIFNLGTGGSTGSRLDLMLADNSTTGGSITGGFAASEYSMGFRVNNTEYMNITPTQMNYTGQANFHNSGTAYTSGLNMDFGGGGGWRWWSPDNASLRVGYGTSNYAWQLGYYFYGNTLRSVTNAADVVPVMVQGAASQTADFQQWQNESNVAYASVSPTGSINAGTALSDTGAILNAVSTRKGFLPPRMTQLQRDSLYYVTGFTLTAGGSGYTGTPTLTVGVGGRLTATGTVQPIAGTGPVIVISLGKKGANYTSTPPTVTISGTGTGATATATVGIPTGLQIFCTDCAAVDGSTGVAQYWNGTSWKDMAGTSIAGTYTPTLSNTTNVTSSTPIICHYARVGNQVTVTGSAGVVTTLAVATVLGISLPVSSNLAATTDASGLAQASSAIAANAYVEGNSTSDVAELKFTGLSVGGSGNLFFTFTYTVL